MLTDAESIINSFKDKKNIFLSGVWGSSFAFFISRIFSKTNKNFIIIFDNNKQAELFFLDLQFFISEDNIIYYPLLDITPYEKIYNKNIIFQRLESYSRISSKKFIFITSLKNIFFKYIPRKTFLKYIIRIKPNDKLDLNQFENNLLQYGYNRNHKVFQKGTFSIRGEIIDVFPPNYSHPVRIELFDELVEEIRFFNINSQKSFKKAEVIQIYPAEEIILNQDNINRFIAQLNTVINKSTNKKPDQLWQQPVFDKNFLLNLKEKIQRKEFFNDIYSYFPLFYKEKESLLECFNKENTCLFLPAYDKLIELYKFINEEMHEFFKKYISRRQYVPSPEDFLFSLKDIQEIAKDYKIIFYNILPFNVENEISFHVKGIPDFSGNTHRFFAFYRDKIKKDYTITFLSEYKEPLENLKSLINKESKEGFKINFYQGKLSKGFEIDIFNEIYIQDFEFFSRIRNDYARTYKSKILTQQLSSIYDLQEGDYIVHIENGIGIYRGIKKIKSDDKVRDFFILEYANGINLFLPLEKINLIHKYIGDEDNPPALNKLGSNEFKRTKNKVERSIISITKDLIKLYAIRDKVKGYKFFSDSLWQKQFELSFKYVETPDQVKVLKEIKDEMESDKPMDRLLCGDVGYGKTEVALRVAFKTVMAGKQAALLVPTTILAQQHHNTFKERLQDYPVRVEVISRFISAKKQKKVLKELHEGKVDIIIGTHRLLSPDVKFNDIGLIIIDEEQRFGVAHKEKLKMIRHIVDVLSMSATPIPRTLYMSLSGIRDISLLETPPEGRIPIETKIEKFSTDEIRKAILTEIERGGQVFFIHNRINSIYAMEDFLKRKVPEAKFLVVHGRMESDELELAMLEFVERNYDVLISTTIIESGIDMPNVNTIIINRSDTFGLSQLYQLRGRVGRGLHRGYALLLYPGNQVITEIAQKRLLTIYEYSDLGSGYKIALRDLEIRGAGNIFGPQQHGNIIAVGFELYSKILRNAVKSVKGEEEEEEWEPDLNFEYNAYIPDSYIDDNKVKIEIYKDLNKCREFEELQLFSSVLEDRFGKQIHKEIQNLFTIQEIKIICRIIHVLAINKYEVKKYEYVFQLDFKEITDNIKKKLEKIFKTYKIQKNYLYINLEKDNFLYELKNKLLLLI